MGRRGALVTTRSSLARPWTALPAQSFTMARATTAGAVDGRFIKQWNPRVTSKTFLHLGPQQEMTNLVLEADLAGSDYTAAMRLMSGPLVGVSYFQSVTERLCMGGEGVYHHGRGFVGTSYSARYATPGWTAYGTLTGDMRLNVAYLRKVSERVKLAAECQVDGSERSAQVGGMGAGQRERDERAKLTLRVAPPPPPRADERGCRVCAVQEQG